MKLWPTWKVEVPALAAGGLGLRVVGVSEEVRGSESSSCRSLEFQGKCNGCPDAVEVRLWE